MAAKDSRTKTPTKRQQFECDYCGDRLRPLHAETIFGLFACDACLVENSDPEDGKDQFEVAARWKRGISIRSIEELLARTSNGATNTQSSIAREQLRRARALYADGELVAAMESAQAAWHASAALHIGLELGPLAKAGKAVIDGRKKPKRPELQAWIEKDVARNPGSTAKDRWARAPDWITDAIAIDRFVKRVTKARQSAGIGRK